MRGAVMILRGATYASIVLEAVGAFSTASTAPLSQPPIVIAGAGPAGLFFALSYLTQNPDGNVHVYEKYPTDPRLVERSQSNAFGFGLGRRTQSHLSAVPGLLERVESQIGAPTPHGSYIVNRNDLCALMLEFAEEKFGNNNRFKVTFGAQAESIECSSSSRETALVLRLEDGTRKKIPFSLLVAADGRNSAIRQNLAACGKLQCKQYLSTMYWKAMNFPSQPKMPSNAFLTYPPQGKRDTVDVGVLMPRHPNQHVALMFWKRNSGHDNPFGAKTAENFKQSLSQTFPDLTDFPTTEEIEYVLNKQEKGTEMWMKVNRHAIPELNVAIIGDAAHSMYSMFGQGCACGLQGARKLSEKLTQMKGTTDREIELAKALHEFSLESTKEGHAISDLNLLAHWDGTKLVGQVRIWDFAKIMPMLNSAEVPYSKIKQTLWWQVALARLLWFFQRVPVTSS